MPLDQIKKDKRETNRAVDKQKAQRELMMTAEILYINVCFSQGKHFY